jgi:hypothetical protein
MSVWVDRPPELAAEARTLQSREARLLAGEGMPVGAGGSAAGGAGGGGGRSRARIRIEGLGEIFGGDRVRSCFFFLRMQSLREIFLYTCNVCVCVCVCVCSVR